MSKHRTSNIEHPTSKVEVSNRETDEQLVSYTAGADRQSGARIEERVFDLEDRLLEYAASIIRLVEQLPKTRAGNHVAAQLLRSGTSPLPNHGEAESAESSADFIHKLKLCLKELRETKRWLRLTARSLVPQSTEIDQLLRETIELTRIFAASIRTAQGRIEKKPVRQQ